MTQTLSFQENGETIGSVTISGNEITTSDLPENEFADRVLALDGLTTYRAKQSSKEGATHVDKITPMPESELVARIELLAQQNGFNAA